jgi:glycosyltransferase involved in cell wall biosynthesis
MVTRLKVALIVPGGVDRSGTHRVIPVLLWLIERLARQVDLHVFALRQEPRPARWSLLGAQVHNVGARPRGARVLAAVMAEHRRAPFALLHAVWANPGAAAAVLGRLLDLPVLIHLTGGDLASLPQERFGLRRTGWGRLQLRVAVAGADRLTTPSGFMVRRAAELGVATELLPFGVALDRWPPSPPRPRDQNLPIRLVHVANLSPVKDQPTLLRAVRALRDRGTPLHLDIVGGDVSGGSVQRLVTDLGLQGDVTFHGFLTQTELRPLVEAADLHVVSSRWEADPIAMLEAAVAGVPTVGTAVGHLIDWAPDAALSVPVAGAVALAGAIDELARDDTRRLAIARAAQAHALRQDADWTAGRVLEIYGETMQRPPLQRGG